MASLPGKVKDAIVEYLGSRIEPATLPEIRRGVAMRIGDVPASLNSIISTAKCTEGLSANSPWPISTHG